MIKQNKHIFIMIFIIAVKSLKTYAQEIKLTDNKGTIKTVINNTVTSGTAPTTPLEGDVWFDTTVTPSVIKIRDGAIWRSIIDTNKWSLTGNTGTNSGTNFLGTTDAQDLVLRAGNVDKLRITNDRGQVRINQATIYNNHPFIIRANGDDVLAFQDATGTTKWHWNLLGNGLNFVESGVLDYVIYLETGGFVGINTNDPTERLDVNGRLRVRTIDVGNLTTDKIIVADANGVIKKVDPTYHTIGDIKNGVQAADHYGWYVLDGRLTGSLSATAETAANSLGFAANLPDATDRILKHPNGGEAIGDIGGQVNTTLIQANLPNITFPTATTSPDGRHDHRIQRRTRARPVEFNGDSNLTFYNRGGNTNTSEEPDHTHTVTVNSGGGDQSFQRYQPYLVVNTFIYLGP